MILSTYMMVELNNRNALIRTYSRMVSCVYMVLYAASMLVPSMEVGIISVGAIAFYLLLFYAYQDKSAVGIIFYAFACIGIASIPFVQILYFLPLLWIILAANILALSVRTFAASILGLIMPYWFLAGYYAYKDNLPALIDHFMELAEFQPLFHYENITSHQIATFIFVTFLAIIGAIHFLRNSYKDKIKVRMFYELFMTVDVCIMAALILQPQHYNELMVLIIINSTPLIAHFMTLTRTKITNIVFFMIIGAILLLTAYNLWIP